MAASLFAWLFNFVELTCLPAALKALILHSFFLFSYVNALKTRARFRVSRGGVQTLQLRKSGALVHQLLIDYAHLRLSGVGDHVAKREPAHAAVFVRLFVKRLFLIGL